MHHRKTKSPWERVTTHTLSARKDRHNLLALMNAERLTGHVRFLTLSGLLTPLPSANLSPFESLPTLEQRLAALFSD